MELIALCWPPLVARDATPVLSPTPIYDLEIVSNRKMGTKRGASPVLSGADEKESKKLNLELGSVHLDDNNASNSSQGATAGESQGGQLGSHDRGADDTLEITKIKADLNKLKNIAMRQRDEIREGITAITNKLGEMFIAHSATATSANFYGRDQL